MLGYFLGFRTDLRHLKSPAGSGAGGGTGGSRLGMELTHAGLQPALRLAHGGVVRSQSSVFITGKHFFLRFI